MSLQIEARHHKIVLEILGPLASQTVVFGSRAKHNAKPLSDLDLAIKAPIEQQELARLKSAFEDSNLPYKVDLVLLSQLDANFLRLVEKDFVPLTAC